MIQVIRNGCLSALWLNIVLVGSLSGAAPHKTNPSDGLIRVRLAKALSSTLIRGTSLQLDFGDQVIHFGQGQEQIQIEVQNLNSGPQWTVRRLTTGEEHLIHNSSLQVTGRDLFHGKNQLPPKVRLLVNSALAPTFDILVSLDLESYLANVLPHEMPISWPLEALKAQAIAARSYTLYQKRQRINDVFDVESSILDQAFKYGRIDNKKWAEKVRKVLEDTKGMVLIDSGLPIKAYYHSDCGGRTELASNVWGSQKSFNGHVSVCNHKGSMPWVYEIEKSFLLHQLAKFIKQDFSLRTLNQISIDSRTESGRAKNIKFSFLESGFLELSAQSVREALGFSKVKSTQFNLEVKDHVIRFEGVGYGHGVGLCQKGAKQLGLKGETFKSILAKYYPDSKIELL